MELPPGFRFHPTDEELVTHYLYKKAMDARFQAWPLAEFDLNKCEPWDLSLKMKMDEKEWYFFGLKERRYPTGLRARRTTDAGYWKATGKDKEIRQGEVLVGMKKTLVFYMGRAPRGEKTHWVMHEYSLESNHYSSIYNLQGTPKSEWVICRVFNKSRGGKQAVDPYASIFETETAVDVTCFSGGISMDSYHSHLLGHSHRPLFSCSELNPDVLGKEITVSAASKEITGITAAAMNGAAGEISCSTAAGEIVTLADKCIWNF